MSPKSWKSLCNSLGGAGIIGTLTVALLRRQMTIRMPTALLIASISLVAMIILISWFLYDLEKQRLKLHEKAESARLEFMGILVETYRDKLAKTADGEPALINDLANATARLCAAVQSGAELTDQLHADLYGRRPMPKHLWTRAGAIPRDVSESYHGGASGFPTGL